MPANRHELQTVSCNTEDSLTVNQIIRVIIDWQSTPKSRTGLLASVHIICFQFHSFYSVECHVVSCEKETYSQPRNKRVAVFFLKKVSPATHHHPCLFCRRFLLLTRMLQRQLTNITSVIKLCTLFVLFVTVFLHNELQSASFLFLSLFSSVVTDGCRILCCCRMVSRTWGLLAMLKVWMATWSAVWVLRTSALLKEEMSVHLRDIS